MGVNDINTNNLPTEGGESNKKNIESTTSSKINQNLQLVSKIYNQLGAEFKNPYMIQTELKGQNNEYTKISVTNPTLAQRSEPEIAITVRPNGKAILKLNPYNRYESTSFTSKELSPDKIFSEVKNVKYLLKDGEPSKDSILHTTKYPSPHTFVEELDSIQKSLETGRMHVNSVFEKEEYIKDTNNLNDWLSEYIEAAPVFAKMKSEREANKGK